MKFEKITYQNVRKLFPFLYECDYGLCDYAPMVLLLWSGFFDYSFAVEGETLFIRQVRNGQVEFLLPVGGDLKAGLTRLKSYCEQSGQPLKLVGVPQSYKDKVEEALGVVLEEMQQSDFDYVYLAQDLISLSGRRFNGQRNHFNRFKRDNPTAVFRPLVPEDKSLLLNFLKEYHKEDGSETFLYDVAAVREFVGRFEEFDFLGGAIFVEKKIVAFAFGDLIGDTLFVHVEKCLRSYSGVGESINRHFVSCFAQKENLFVNREEDMGDLGMRKAKMSYFPLIRKKFAT